MVVSFIRALSSAIYLLAVVFTIPLAFDVGGRTCGLAFSLTLATFYNIYSLLRLITPNHSRFRYAVSQLVSASQWIVIPTLLIWSLNKFSVDSNDHAGASWVARTFNRKRAQDESISDWFFGRGGVLESSTIGVWDKALRWLIPVFQIAEGFCSLLVIQASGQISRWAVNRENGDNWMVRRGRRVLRYLLTIIDWTHRHVSLHYLKLMLLPLPHHHFPGNRKRGRYSHRSCNYLCDLPLCMGHWQWERECNGELTSGTLSYLKHDHRFLTITVCICHAMYLPDLHRLSTYTPRRACATTASARLPTPTSNHHGLIFDTDQPHIDITNQHSPSLPLHHRGHHDNHTLRHHLTRLPRLRTVRRYKNHSRGTRIWSSSTFTGTYSRRQRRSRPGARTR